MATCLATLLPLGCATQPSRDTEQSQIRYQLAVGYYREQRTEAAIEELRHALRADPDNAHAENLLGLIALNEGHDHLVQGEIAACLEGEEAAAVSKDAREKFEQAKQHLSRAVAMDPQLAEAWNNLSVAALQLEQWPLAAKAATEALRDATFAEPQLARANLGWALFKANDLMGAWKQLHRAVSRYPDFCVARYRLAKVYVERNEPERAKDHVDAVMAAKACPIQEAYLLGGLVYGRLGNKTMARKLFRDCAALAPRSCVAKECRRSERVLAARAPSRWPRLGRPALRRCGRPRHELTAFPGVMTVRTSSHGNSELR